MFRNSKYLAHVILSVFIMSSLAWGFGGVSTGVWKRDNATSTLSTVTANDNIEVGDSTQTSANPTINLKDSNATAGDVNASIDAQATDTGDGSEDIDVTIKQQVDGNITAFITADADGTLDLGTASQNTKILSNIGVNIDPILSSQTTGKAITIYDDINGGFVELANDSTTNGESAGKVSFLNTDNSDAGGSTRLDIVRIEASIVTSDSNDGDDSGGDLIFRTKAEAGFLTENMKLDSTGALSVPNGTTTIKNTIIDGGTNTFSITNGTSSLDVAAAATADINQNITVSGSATTFTNGLTFGATNGGSIDFSAASKTLTVEDNSVINQDLSSDNSPTFTGATMSGLNTANGVVQTDGSGVLSTTLTPSGLTSVTATTLTANGASLTGGTNTFDITNGTASLNVAAASAVNIDANLTVEAAATVNQDLTSDASPQFANATLSRDGNIVLNFNSGSGQYATIRNSTTDGTDNKTMRFCGGGDAIDTRGAIVVANGNETGTYPGDIVLTSGDTGNVVIPLRSFGVGEENPETQIEMTGTAPYITLHNNTEEDGDGGRESKLLFKGEQSGAEETTLASIVVQHDGTSDDQKGEVIISVNDGNDGNSPTEAVRINSAGSVGIGTNSPNASTLLHLYDDTGSAVQYIQTTDTASYAALESYSDTADIYLTAYGSTYSGTIAGLTRESMTKVEAKEASSLVVSTVNSGTAPIVFAPGRAEKVRIDSSGNVGFENSSLETWDSVYTALQVGGNGSVAGSTTAGASKDFNIIQNAYYDSGDSRWEYQDTDEASMCQQTDGTHTFRVAASGTADTEITWTTAMTIDNSANIGIGTSAPSDYQSAANNLVVYEAGNGGITIAGGTSDSGALYFADGTSGDAEYRGYINYAHATDSMTFATAATTQMTITDAGGIAYAPTSDQTIAAGTGITATMLKRIIRVAGNSGNIDITANPQIADGTDGQLISIQGTNDTDTVQFDDGNGLQLNGDASCTLGQGDFLHLMYDSGDDVWYEFTPRSNN